MDITIKCSHEDLIDIDKLVENPKNPNKHPENQIRLLAKIIKFQGWRHPVIISNRTGFVVAGHGRLAAARELGVTEIPVDYQDFENEAEEYAFLIADNKIAELANHDDGMMIEEIKELGIEDFELLGMEDFQLPPEPDPAKEEIENEIPDNVETRVKPGELWQLGEHRLFCGDATNLSHVETLMGEEKAALIITDPPYNVAYEGKTKDSLTIKNDEMDNDSFYQFLYDTFVNYFTVTHAGAPIYVFHADTEGVNFRRAMTEGGFKMAQCLVWVKNTMVMGRSDYHWKHEPILYGWKEGKAHTWMSDRKQTTVWNFNKPNRNAEHPTMKPIDLLEYPISNSSAVGSLVIDFFGGSGSTLITCEKLNRKCYTMELDPKYADVILARWEKYSEKTAKRVKIASEE